MIRTDCALLKLIMLVVEDKKEKKTTYSSFAIILLTTNLLQKFLSVTELTDIIIRIIPLRDVLPVVCSLTALLRA